MIERASLILVLAISMDLDISTRYVLGPLEFLWCPTAHLTNSASNDKPVS